jgi:hypothetical protein
MKRLVLFLLFTFPLFSQIPVPVAPDCTIGPVPLSATARYPSTPTLGYPNTNGCVYWTLFYKSTGFTILHLELDSAPDASGVAGTWAAFTGTLEGGTINPATNIVGGYILAQANSAGGAPWVSMKLDTLTGSGTVTAFAYGYKQNPFGSTAAAIAANVTIVGPLGQALMAASVPVVIASNQSAVPVTFSGTADENIKQVGGVNVPALNGSLGTLLGCPSQASVALSGTGYTEIVIGTAAQVIHVCKIFVTSGAANAPVVNTFTVASATITTCAGPTVLPVGTGITGIDSDFGGSLTSVSGASICVKEAVANSDVVYITYAKF